MFIAGVVLAAAEVLTPITFRASGALESNASTGRWGASIERLPVGFGVGFGAAAGFVSVKEQESRAINGGYLRPSLALGYAMRRDGEVHVAGWFGAYASAPIDVLTTGVRASLIGQPMFLMGVERFVFGLGLPIGAVVASSVEGHRRGFTVGFEVALGAVL
jgi:hypothetical protein